MNDVNEYCVTVVRNVRDMGDNTLGPLKHLGYSATVAAVLFATSKDAKAALCCLASGVLVDLDHFIEYRDYCKDYGVLWDWKEFSTGNYFTKKGTVKVIFHSWEAAALLWVMTIAMRKIGRKSPLYGISVGYTLHLILDGIGNNLNRKGYFELYRYLVDWKQEKLI